MNNHDAPIVRAVRPGLYARIIAKLLETGGGMMSFAFKEDSVATLNRLVVEAFTDTLELYGRDPLQMPSFVRPEHGYMSSNTMLHHHANMRALRYAVHEQALPAVHSANVATFPTDTHHYAFDKERICLLPGPIQIYPASARTQDIKTDVTFAPTEKSADALVFLRAVVNAGTRAVTITYAGNDYVLKGGRMLLLLVNRESRGFRVKVALDADDTQENTVLVHLAWSRVPGTLHALKAGAFPEAYIRMHAAIARFVFDFGPSPLAQNATGWNSGNGISRRRRPFPPYASDELDIHFPHTSFQSRFHGNVLVLPDAPMGTENETRSFAHARIRVADADVYQDLIDPTTPPELKTLDQALNDRLADNRRLREGSLDAFELAWLHFRMTLVPDLDDLEDPAEAFRFVESDELFKLGRPRHSLPIGLDDGAELALYNKYDQCYAMLEK